MKINAIKERCGYKGGIRPEAPRCGACVHAVDKPAGTKCKKYNMRVSYFGLCNDYETPIVMGESASPRKETNA